MYLMESPNQAPADIFLVATAVKGSTVSRVARALVKGARRHRLVAGSFPAGDDKGPNDVELFACPDGWVVLRWFEYCTCHLPVSQELSDRLSRVVLTVDVCEDVWRHVVFDRGRVADRFASSREHVDLWGSGGHSWAGDPRVLASLAGGDPAALARYLVEVSGVEPSLKAHPDDRFDLSEPLVFTDLWRRIGIRYPGEDDRADAIVRYGEDWEEKLPYEVADF